MSKKKILNATIWKSFGQFSIVFINFTVSIFLARLLSPSDFGYISMITFFAVFSRVLIDSGFSSALIQRKVLKSGDISTVFFVNLILGLIISGIFYLSAQSIADFYNEQILVKISKIMAINLILHSIYTVPLALLNRDINFKSQSKIYVFSSVFSGFVAVFFAYFGYEYWSLVIRELVYTFSLTIFSFYFVKWRPSIEFDFKSLKEIFKYSSNLLISSFITVFFTNIYSLFIGKVYSPADLGYFNRGQSFQLLIINNSSSIINNLTFPVMSSFQDDIEKSKKMLFKSVRYTSLVLFPSMLCLFLFSENIIITLLGEKWRQSVQYLQIFSLMGLFMPFNTPNISLLNAFGYSNRFLRIEIIRRVMLSIVILSSYTYGIYMMLLCHLIFISTSNIFINSYYTKELINYSIFTQLNDVQKIFYAALIAFSICFALNSFFDGFTLISLIIKIVVYISIYLGSLILIDKRILNELKDLKKNIKR